MIDYPEVVLSGLARGFGLASRVAGLLANLRTVQVESPAGLEPWFAVCCNAAELAAVSLQPPTDSPDGIGTRNDWERYFAAKGATVCGG